MINISERAKTKITHLQAEDKALANRHVRVSVKSGGCSGLKYTLDFDEQILPTDAVCEDKGLKILVDKKSLLYLVGTTLDFSDGLSGKGFEFINPNATRTCGCGESFAV